MAISKYQENVTTKAINVQNKMAGNKETELQILKSKYKPIKCKYCGTMNSPKKNNCKNCGAILENIDNRLL